MKTFTAKVSGDMIAKATRLFNATIDQILTELLQNARRAGATVIDLSCVRRQDSKNMLDFCIIDNGIGCQHPEDMFHLGKSTWNTDITTTEDPAGMGVFCLAGCEDIKIVSRTAAAEAWTVYLENAHFNGKADIKPLPSDMQQQGTEIYFSKMSNDAHNIHTIIESACRYLPVKVILNGTAIQQQDFLHDALYVQEYKGIRYAVCPKQYASVLKPICNINFYGHGLCEDMLPCLKTDAGKLCVKIDVQHTNGLELVLPQRNEVVHNEKFDAVCAYAYKVLYGYVADNNISHNLPYKVYQHAQSFGYDIGEAKSKLRAVCGMIDSDAVKTDITDTVCFLSENMIQKWHDSHHDFMASWVSGGDTDTVFVEPDTEYAGYSWYNTIATVIDVMLWCNGKPYSRQNDSRQNNQVGWKVSDIHIELKLSNGKTVKRPIGMFVSGCPGLALASVQQLWIDPNKICLDSIIAIFKQYMFDYYGSDDSFEESWKYFKTEVMEQAINIAFQDNRMLLIEEIIHQSGLGYYLRTGESYTITKNTQWQAKITPNFDLWFWIRHVCSRLYNRIKIKPSTT